MSRFRPQRGRRPLTVRLLPLAILLLAVPFVMELDPSLWLDRGAQAGVQIALSPIVRELGDRWNVLRALGLPIAGSLAQHGVHQVVGGVQGFLDATVGSLIDDARAALQGASAGGEDAVARLAAKVFLLATGLILLPVTVRGLERAFRTAMDIFPHTLGRWISKKVARFVGEGIAYLTASIAAATALF